MDAHGTGQRIRQRRTTLGLTQERLAELAELSPPYVSHIERGQKSVSLEALLRIAAALETTPDMLLIEPAARNTVPSHYTEMQALLEDCSLKQRGDILKVVSLMKSILRQYP